MEKTLYIVLLLFVLLLVPVKSKAQHLNLKYVYNIWALKHMQPQSDIMVFKSARLRNAQSKGFSNTVLNFVKGKDSIIYQGQIIDPGIGCGNQRMPQEILSEQAWIIDERKMKLRRDIYIGDKSKVHFPDYSVIYNIFEIKRDILKLQLEKELFEGR